MHVATRLYDTLAHRFRELIKDRFNYDPVENSRPRALVRLAALLHDVGHSAFSHTAEHLMPAGLRHEDYSAELIRHEMRDVIEEHPENANTIRIQASEIADFFQGRASVRPELLFWKELISGQIDADRMDYLLRDALHCGVEYGRFDLKRVMDTTMVVENSRTESPAGLSVGISEGGVHAAEGLILARYFMFTQVYFHPVRKAYDHHAAECVRLLLEQSTDSKRQLPDPRTAEGRDRFLRLDDWSVCEFIKSGSAGRHGDAILRHTHDRCVLKTGESPTVDELSRLDEQEQKLREAGIETWMGDAEKEWYTLGTSEIQIGAASPGSDAPRLSVPLSEISHVVRIPESKQRQLFVPLNLIDRSRTILKLQGAARG
jgi:hypothetical protein